MRFLAALMALSACGEQPIAEIEGVPVYIRELPCECEIDIVLEDLDTTIFVLQDMLMYHDLLDSPLTEGLNGFYFQDLGFTPEGWFRAGVYTLKWSNNRRAMGNSVVVAPHRHWRATVAHELIHHYLWTRHAVTDHEHDMDVWNLEELVKEYWDRVGRREEA